jgi:hypothetical protein
MAWRAVGCEECADDFTAVASFGPAAVKHLQPMRTSDLSCQLSLPEPADDLTLNLRREREVTAAAGAWAQSHSVT